MITGDGKRLCTGITQQKINLREYLREDGAQSRSTELYHYKKPDSLNMYLMT